MSTLKNKAGRTYERGKPLSNNVRNKIISELEQKFNGNKQNYSISRGGFAEVSKKFCITKPTVSSIWTKYCTDTLGSDTWKPRGRPKKLTDADLDFIEHMKTQKPLATADTINAELSTHSATRVTPRTINTAVRSYLPRRWTNKKVIACRKRTYNNLVYTYIHVSKLKASSFCLFILCLEI